MHFSVLDCSEEKTSLSHQKPSSSTSIINNFNAPITVANNANFGEGDNIENGDYITGKSVY